VTGKEVLVGAVHKVHGSGLLGLSSILMLCKNLPYCRLPYSRRSWDSSVGIATGYGLDDPGSILFHSIQTGSGAHPSSYAIVPGAIPPGVKRPGREADHSAPTTVKFKNGGAIPPLPHMSSWHSAGTNLYVLYCILRCDAMHVCLMVYFTKKSLSQFTGLLQKK
jgi:hypothetical protein